MQQTPAFGHRPAFGSAAAACNAPVSHELFFVSLFDSGRALSFPCDPLGVVQLDELSERARNNYFFARGTVGRDFGSPIVISLQDGSRH